MKGLLAWLLVFLVLSTTAALAQEDSTGTLDYGVPGVRDFTGGGARSMGMGHAFLGVSDDVSAVSWNPAGLYRKDTPFEQPVMGLEYNSYKGVGDYRLLGFQGNQVFDEEGKFNGWSMVSFLAPVRIKGHPFVFSGSYHRLDDEFWNTGFTYDTAIYYTVSDEEAGTPRPFSSSMSATYHSGVDALAVGFGTRLYENLSFGLTFNRYAGNSVSNRTFRRIQDGLSPVEWAPQRIVRTNDSTLLDSAEYSGVYFKAGFYYAASKLSAGLVISTPHKLVQTVDRKEIKNQYTNGRLDPYEGTLTLYHDDNLVEVEQPLVIGGGIGYRVMPNLLWALDLEYRGYSGKEIRQRDSLQLNPGGKDIEYFRTFETNWNNVLAVRTGAEYIWTTGKAIVPTVPIRAGFGYVQVPDANVDASLSTSTAAKTDWSIGSGIHWQQIYLDFAYLHSSVTWEIHTPAVVVNDLTMLDSEMASTNHRFKVTFTGFF
jgi:hypothetical protein